jgi:hypothetical protein
MYVCMYVCVSTTDCQQRVFIVLQLYASDSDQRRATSSLPQEGFLVGLPIGNDVTPRTTSRAHNCLHPASFASVLFCCRIVVL